MRRLRPGRGAKDDQSRWVEAALDRYEDRNLTRVTVARTLMFATIGVWLFLNYGAEVLRQNLLPFALFIGFGLLAYALMHGRPDRFWLRHVFVALDALLLGFILFAPGWVYPEPWPWQIALRLSLFLFFLTFPALALLTFRPGLVLWAGVAASLTILGWTWLIAAQPGAVVGMGPGAGALEPELLGRFLAPTYVHADDAVVRVFVILVLAALMAFAAHRARRLIHEQAHAARERANLARYLTPSMVERLARTDNPMTQVRRQEAAVLFADIRGFTALCEGMDAEAVMRLLRSFHGAMAEAVFAHDGTLDKFIGDGLMATFGTPEAADDDAQRALACALAMLDSVAAWNRERAAAGEPLVRVGIGVHHGPVIMGDIGGADRFEFAVIGDTVNVANRLEELTRALDVPLVVSDAALRRVGAADPAAAGFIRIGERALRGRSAPLAIWAWPGLATRLPAVAG
jgi:adenylate cyclase